MRVIARGGFSGNKYAEVKAILRLRPICAHGKNLLREEDLKMMEGSTEEDAIEIHDDEDEVINLSLQEAHRIYTILKRLNIDNCSICKQIISSSDPTANEVTNPKVGTICFMAHCGGLVCGGCVHGIQKEEWDPESTNSGKLPCQFCGKLVEIPLLKLKRNVNCRKKAKSLGRYKRPHTKTKALVASLLQSQEESNLNPSESPVKSIVFSGWTSHLDLIEIALKENGISYTRLDGKISRRRRKSTTAWPNSP
ncbi:MAG: hypothetical protein M1813_002195 [Trichoglossum hirsutum]|nr:MAG: hypothetical protein M1813_002195 [Trichoglossum hirsutum]